NNLCIKKQKVSKETGKTFAKILAPFAPHLAEELWQLLGNTNTLSYEKFPEFDPKYLIESNFTYPVSFNGKKRFDLALPVDMPVAEIEKVVLADPSSAKWLEGKAPKKVIIVPNRIINVVL
ncbi:MAG TPA: class I tRNA ligase family protein, partial [Bacteroidales bacterium]|nr:class I tRNA ligase family protein [Bacteroidales bacterium]